MGKVALPKRISEKNFRKKVDAFLKLLPCCKSFSAQQLTIRGTPDKLLCLAGRFVGLELKASSSAHRSILQEYHLMEIRRAGGVGMFVFPENWEETKELLTILSRGEK